jgi:hypothetical protein
MTVPKSRTPASSGGARRLPIVRIARKLYYMDSRLREFRCVDDFMDRIDFAEKPRFEVVEA